MNRVILVGRLTKDPELRYTQSGKGVASFTVAVNRPFKTNGEQEADFINGVVWGKPAENLANYMKKGSQIGVDGRIQTRSYDNNEGKRVYVTEVVADSVSFLDSKGKQGGRQQAQPQQPQKNDNPFANDGEPIEVDESSLPF